MQTNWAVGEAHRLRSDACAVGDATSSSFGPMWCIKQPSAGQFAQSKAPGLAVGSQNPVVEALEQKTLRGDSRAAVLWAQSKSRSEAIALLSTLVANLQRPARAQISQQLATPGFAGGATSVNSKYGGATTASERRSDFSRGSTSSTDDVSNLGSGTSDSGDLIMDHGEDRPGEGVGGGVGGRVAPGGSAEANPRSALVSPPSTDSQDPPLFGYTGCAGREGSCHSGQ